MNKRSRTKKTAQGRDLTADRFHAPRSQRQDGPQPTCGTCGWPIGDVTDPAYAGCYTDRCTDPRTRAT